MQESQTGDTVKKRHDRGTLIKVLLVRPPGLQCTAGHIKHLRRLTLGHPLGFEVAIALKLLRAFEAAPVLVAVIMATLLVLIIVPTATSSSASHGHGKNAWLRMARDLFVATLHDVETLIVGDRQLGQVADAVVEARRPSSALNARLITCGRLKKVLLFRVPPWPESKDSQG